ncbi:helix-turn-helix transcriptional regulator [candidate division KSB1 bacterium]
MEYNNPVSRTVKIIQLFAFGRRITVNELYDVFERKVDKRTLQRDLIRISEAGIPLVTLKGNKNENIWSIDRQFYNFFPTPLSLNEYIVANYMKKAVPVFRKTPIENDYIALLDKMDQLLSPDVVEAIDSKSEYFENTFDALEFGYCDYSGQREIIQKIVAAILDKNVCELTYQSLGNPVKTFKIEPYKTLIYAGALYLVAFIREYNNFYHFAVQRMKDIEVLNNNFVKNQDYDNRQFVKDRFGLVSSVAEEVVLYIDRDIVPHIEGRVWHHSQKMKKTKDGSMELKMKVSICDEFIGWILKWMGHITVIKPESLKQEIQKILKEMTGKFNKNSL